MAQKNTPETETKQKVQTKYDRKMEARRQQKLKEAKQEKVTKFTAAAVGILLVLVIVVSAAVSVISKNRALNGTYVKIGEHELSQLEYDYYYNTAVNNYLVSYSSLLPYMGLDTSADFDKQQYTENMTWKDMFDEMTVEQIKQTKAMADDAANVGFVYDNTVEYDTFKNNLKDAAEAANISLKEYYRQSFGDYATEKNIQPFVEESMLANAYYDEMLVKNTPSDEEVKAYYEDNKQLYDKVDFRSFIFNTDLSSDASEEEISEAMDGLKEKAEAMMKARKDGGDFEELCAQNASEDAKANYENAETEYSLSEGRNYSGITSVMAQWLYEDGRKEGDITVLRDDYLHQYYVVEFIKKYFDEADNASISNTIATQKVTEYMTGMVVNYEVVDVKGDLKYLTIPPAENTSTDDVDNSSGAVSTDGASSEDKGNTDEAEVSEENTENNSKPAE